MSKVKKQFVILYAEDNPADRLLFEEAVAENDLQIDLRIVADGQDAIDYLRQTGSYSDPASAPRPALILLDLSMPRKNGDEALTEIKSDLALRRIPVIIMSSVEQASDIACVYDLGANSFIPKPHSFDSFISTVKTLGRYWMETVALP
jgi:CheY-like chemotaxis protein